MAGNVDSTQRLIYDRRGTLCDRLDDHHSRTLGLLPRLRCRPVVDGRIVAAAQEERFTPQEARLELSVRTPSTTACARPVSTSTRSTTSRFTTSPCSNSIGCSKRTWRLRPSGFASFRKAIPVWIKEKLFQDRELRAGPAAAKFTRRFIYAVHHVSHAASAFFPSPFEEAAILTLDGVGEWATATLRRRPRQRDAARRTSCAFRTRSACSIPRSPTSAASRSTPASTS